LARDEALMSVADHEDARVLLGGARRVRTRVRGFARPTEVLDITDLDPSGAHMFLAAIEDIKAFTRELGGEVTFTRLAVTREQIAQYDLPTAPPKATDKRAFRGRTCQAEALAPDVLAGILRHAIEQRIDHRVLDRVLKRERAERRKLVRLLGDRP
jgi:hypothetical protein